MPCFSLMLRVPIVAGAALLSLAPLPAAGCAVPISYLHRQPPRSVPDGAVVAQVRVGATAANGRVELIVSRMVSGPRGITRIYFDRPSNHVCYMPPPAGRRGTVVVFAIRRAGDSLFVRPRLQSGI